MTEEVEHFTVNKELRHLEGVIVRNLDSKNLYSTYFTLSVESKIFLKFNSKRPNVVQKLSNGGNKCKILLFFKN
jgi:hypothetical protein